MKRFLEVVLLVVLALMCIDGLVWAPSVCLNLLVKAVAVVAGLVLLTWIWGWRRPKLRIRAARLASAVCAVAKTRVPVLSVYWLRPASRPGALRVVVATDADRAALRGESFQAEFRRLVTESGLPMTSRGSISFTLTVDSQETVDRDFRGSWFDHDR